MNGSAAEGNIPDVSEQSEQPEQPEQPMTGRRSPDHCLGGANDLLRCTSCQRRLHWTELTMGWENRGRGNTLTMRCPFCRKDNAHMLYEKGCDGPDPGPHVAYPLGLPPVVAQRMRRRRFNRFATMVSLFFIGLLGFGRSLTGATEGGED